MEGQPDEHAQLKKVRSQLVRAMEAHMRALITTMIAAEQSGEPVNSEAPPKKKAKKDSAAKPEDDGPFECAGNVITGEPCLKETPKHLIKAAATRHEKKTHVTCKECKPKIEKAKKAVAAVQE